jgi:hypothetical protein
MGPPGRRSRLAQAAHVGWPDPCSSALPSGSSSSTRPVHVADLARYRAWGHAMTGNRVRLVTDRPKEVVEMHSPSVNAVSMAGVTVEYYPPAPAMG